MEVKAKPAVRDYVAERVAAGLCLIGPKVSEAVKEQCERCAEKRGVCTMHYQQYRAEYLKTPAEKQGDFETDQIKAGKILPSNQGSPRDRVNAYAGAN